jgi:hypothetical protein
MSKTINSMFSKLIKNYIRNNVQSIIVYNVPILSYVLTNSIEQNLVLLIGSKIGLSKTILLTIILFL